MSGPLVRQEPASPRLGRSRTRPQLATYSARLAVPSDTLTVIVNPRCDRAGCGKLFAHYLTLPYALECPRCGLLNQAGIPGVSLPPAQKEAP